MKLLKLQYKLCKLIDMNKQDKIKRVMHEFKDIDN